MWKVVNTLVNKPVGEVEYDINTPLDRLDAFVEEIERMFPEATSLVITLVRKRNGK